MNFRAMYERIHGWVGSKVYGLTFYIDVVDGCPFGCKTCPVGVEARRDGHRMSIDTFREILDKASQECKIRKIQLYRWSDPLIHPDLDLFVRECRERQIRCSTSSALKVMKCDLQKVIEARPDEFRISFSGWKNLHIYQKGNSVQRFFENFEILMKLPRHKETTWVLYFHQYKDNIGETQAAERLARENNLKFVAFPATFMVYDHIIDGYTEEDRHTLKMLTETPEENILRFKREPKSDDYCNMQSKEVTLDSRGEMQLCQLMFRREYGVGDFLVNDLGELRKKIMNHDMCGRCKSKGVGHYSLIFADPVVEEKPVESANAGKYLGSTHRFMTPYEDA